MMSELLKIDDTVLNDPDNINAIIEMAQAIMSASESDFETMKNKGIIKRFFEIVTFSKNNEKMIANNITQLDKMQEIVIKLLLRLYSKNSKVSDMLKVYSQKVLALGQTNIKLANAIKKIKYGSTERHNIAESSPEHQNIIVAALRSFVINSGLDNEYANRYISNIRKHISIMDVEGADFDLNKIVYLSSSEHELLFILLCETACLMDIDFINDHTHFEKYCEYISVSRKKQKEISKKVLETKKVEGKDFIANLYFTDDQNEILVIDSDGIEFCDISVGKTENHDNEENNNFTDEAIYEYRRLREIVGEYIPQHMIYSIIENEIQVNDVALKKARNFIKKNSLNLAEPSLVAFIDTTVFGGAKEGFLITTNAIYYKEIGEEFQYMEFGLIEESYPQIAFISNGKRELRLLGSKSLVDKDLYPMTISSQNIDIDIIAKVIHAILKEMDNDINIASFSDINRTPYSMGFDVMKAYISILHELFQICGHGEQRVYVSFVYKLLYYSDFNEYTYNSDKEEYDVTVLDNLPQIFAAIMQYQNNNDMVRYFKDLKEYSVYPSYEFIIKYLIADCYRLNYLLNKNTISMETNEFIDTIEHLTNVHIDDSWIPIFIYELQIEDGTIADKDIILANNLVAEFGVNAGFGGVVGLMGLPGILVSIPVYFAGKHFYDAKKCKDTRKEVLTKTQEEYHDMITKFNIISEKYDISIDSEFQNIIHYYRMKYADIFKAISDLT